MPDEVRENALSFDRASKWLISDEGQRRLQQAADRADQKVAELRAARQIAPDDLKLPVTV